MGDHTQQIINQKYHLDKKLGSGGMGAVYRARHTVIGKKVAVKILHAEYITNDNVIHRFYREAQAAAEIGHKNIIDVMDVGVTDNNEPFIVMEFLEGEGLEHLSKRLGPLDMASVCGIIEPVLQALAAAHKKDIVHRDLKPENIFLACEKNSAPTVKLIDFGISKFLSAENNDKMTRTGTILGTPSYMAPEQARGSIDEIDHRADIYAVGVIIYELLTCGLPFEGRNYNELIVNILTEEMTDPFEKNPKFPEEALPVVKKALAKNREDRYQSAEEFLTALRQTNPFNERNNRMTQLGSTLMTTAYATGDLVTEQTNETSKGASGILSSLAPQTRGSTTAWSSTAASNRPMTPLIIAAAVVLLAITGIISWSLMNRPVPVPPVQPAAAPPAAPAEPVGQEDGVQITLNNLPENATVLYDGMKVAGASFRVRYGTTLRRLEVRADGFQPLVQSVVPSKDLQIAVTMQPVPEKPAPQVAPQPEPVAKPKAKAKRRTRRRAPAKKATAPAKPKEEMRKGARNTNFTDDFE